MKNKPTFSNQLQARYLRTRVEAAKRKHLYAVIKGKTVEPAKIKAARALVKQYDEKVYKAERARIATLHKAIEADAEKALRSVLFDAPQKALAVVDGFENRKFA